MPISKVGNVMPTGNQIPKLWADRALATYLSDFVVPQVVNTEYEGKISKVGDQVVIPKEAAISTFSYKKGQKLQKQTDFADDTLTLDISYADYFNVPVADMDRLQTSWDFASRIMDRGGHALGVKVEQQVLTTVHASAGSTVTAAALDASNALKFLMQAKLKLIQRNVPQEDLWAIIDPITAYFLGLSDLKQAYMTGDSDSSLRTGSAVEKPVAGFQCYISNNLQASATSAKVLVGHKDAITFAGQVTKMETLRDGDDFGDVLRGMMAYGYKVVQPDALVLVDVTSFGSL